MSPTKTGRPSPYPAARRWVLLILLSLLPGLACNFPMLARQPQANPDVQLLQTLSARLTAIAQNGAPTALGATAPVPTAPPGLPTVLAPQTATPGGTPDVPATPLPGQVGDGQTFAYIVQSGDTLPALASRFGVEAGQMTSSEALPAQAYLSPGQLLLVPNQTGETPYPSALLPDSEVVFSPSTADFDIAAFVDQAGGFLSSYTEQVGAQALSGAEIIRRVSSDLSINPRLLLACLEYRSGWVLGQPDPSSDLDHPLGFNVPGYRGLFNEITFTATKLNMGYYGWRQGTLTELSFQNGSRARIAPQLNAGSVALQYLFSQFYDPGAFLNSLYATSGFLALYQRMFGDPWAGAERVGPLLPAGLLQPPLELPFSPGEEWSFSGGPHLSWNTGTPMGAIDFSPNFGSTGCKASPAWVTAPAPGVVVLAERNMVVLDLDGAGGQPADGLEQTGWSLLVLHLADTDLIQAGIRVDQGDRLGHPSCQGGRATGTNVHLARRFNGEWLPASGPLPFVLSGWQVNAGAHSYEGYLLKEGQTISADPSGSSTSLIIH